jgi:hypothetical protein
MSVESNDPAVSAGSPSGEPAGSYGGGPSEIIHEDFPSTWEPGQEIPEEAAAPEAAVPAAQSVPVAAEPVPTAGSPDGVQPDPPRDEAERLDPVPTGPLTLSSGTVVEIVPLKLRETMRLLKIVTRGGGGFLQTMAGGLDFEDGAAFGQTLGAMLVMSIPEAENEAVEFIQSMCLPVGFEQMDPKLRVPAQQALFTELYNPELEDVISIIERVIARESEDIRGLGKRIQTAFNLGRRTGQLPTK